MQEVGSKDAELLAGIAQGSPSIVQQVYGKYFSSITKYILRNSGTVNDAQDIFQDAMMVLFEKSMDSNFELKYSLHTYLFTICRNLWLKKIRKKSNQLVSLPDEMVLISEDSFEEELNWREKEKLYRRKFKELSEVCQKVLQMQLAGNSMVEIAEKMGYASAGYAKKKKYKCKNQLLKLIQADPLFSKLTHI